MPANASRAPSARLVVAAAASLLVHAAMLALPPGEGDTRWTPGVASDAPLVLIVEPSHAETIAAVTASPDVAVPAPAPSPVAVAPARAAIATPKREPGPKPSTFAYSMFRTAEDGERQRALDGLARNGVDVAADAVATVAVGDFIHIGFVDDSRGPMRAIAAAVVGADGSVEDVVVIDGDEPFAGYVAGTIRSVAFAPAIRNGAPVRSYAVLAIDFCPAGSPAGCPGGAGVIDTAPTSPPARAAN